MSIGYQPNSMDCRCNLWAVHSADRCQAARAGHSCGRGQCPGQGCPGVSPPPFSPADHPGPSSRSASFFPLLFSHYYYYYYLWAGEGCSLHIHVHATKDSQASAPCCFHASTGMSRVCVDGATTSMHMHICYMSPHLPNTRKLKFSTNHYRPAWKRWCTCDWKLQHRSW